MDNMSRRGYDPLTYRFENEIPKPGNATEVADGVFWIRMPMQGRLDHVNVWLLKDGDGWMVVDTGLFNASVQDCWRRIFENYLDGKPITRVIATHLHSDHTGLAGWIVKEFGGELWMSRADFYMCKTMAADGPSDLPDDAIRFYRRAGFDEQRLDRYRQRFGQFGANIAPLPAGYRRIRDGQYLVVDGREWRAVIGHGHRARARLPLLPGAQTHHRRRSAAAENHAQRERATFRASCESSTGMDLFLWPVP